MTSDHDYILLFSVWRVPYFDDNVTVITDFKASRNFDIKTKVK